jgi:flagellar hook protein FlgE
MSVIGNNLANTNTLGFKGARAVFSDLLSSTVSGSGGASQIGRGVSLSSITNIFSQGTFETTASGTDVAIEGDGFFVLKEAGKDTDFYSRAGAFYFNQDGYLVNPEGYEVQGKLFDPEINDELLPDDPSSIRIVNVGLTGANATTEMTFTTNLDENSTVIPLTKMIDDPLSTPAVPLPQIEVLNPIDPADRDTYNYSASSKIYDSLGESHLITVYWRLVNDQTNTWQSAYTIDNDPATLQDIDMYGDPPLGTADNNLDGHPSGLTDTNQALQFDEFGKLIVYDAAGVRIPDQYISTVSIDLPAWANGASAQTIELSFDCTQYDSDSVVIGQNQNGYGAGELTNVAIDGDGVVVASYSNGQQVNIAQLVLAKFQNSGGLRLAGSNRFIATEEVGSIRVGLPGPELGKIFTNSLEQSNVDMGQEFVKMIITQRGFQANSKIITTVDEMLSELINLKR